MDYKDEKRKRIIDKKAAALKYERGDSAPRVVASGVGYLAERIERTAVEGGVKVLQNKELVEELVKINIGDAIPPELYDVVAKILIYINELDSKEMARKYGLEEGG
jgi:flagellar biosynthesis protein